MKRRASITVALLGAPLPSVTFAETLEVSLPCSVCVRNDRTVLLTRESGICVKRQHPFAGSILDLRTLNMGEEARAVYLIEYEWAPFVDAKDGLPAEALPMWARVSFKVRCPSCSRESAMSTQTNVHRPLSVRCSCGAVLFQEREEMPRIEAGFKLS